MEAEVSVLREDEFLEQMKAYKGLDNPVVEAYLTGITKDSDVHKKQTISYNQYLRMKEADARLDDFWLRMSGPLGVGLVQATKIQKWWGMGQRPIELLEAQTKEETPKEKEAREARAKREMPRLVPKDDIVIYPCNEKYPGCIRFFDSTKARQTHWGLEHERVKKNGRKENAPKRYSGSEKA